MARINAVLRRSGPPETGASLTERVPPLPLDDHRGTREVRQTAQVFNAMATQLHAQFAAQTLPMAAISHDLRRPLARLRLRLEGWSQAEAAIADVRAMDSMIGSVLEMMREQHLSTPPQRFDLLALVIALTDDLVEAGEPVEVSDSQDDAAPVIVAAPPEALQRVLGNLVGNALLHGGSARIVLGACGDGRSVAVHIDDDGPGLPVHELEAVFRPFYRAAPTTGDAAPGTGLDLTIVPDLTQRLGGTLTLAHRAEGGLRRRWCCRWGDVQRVGRGRVTATTHSRDTGDTCSRDTARHRPTEPRAMNDTDHHVRAHHGLVHDLDRVAAGLLRRRRALLWIAGAAAVPLIACGGGGDADSSSTSHRDLHDQRQRGRGLCGELDARSVGLRARLERSA